MTKKKARVAAGKKAAKTGVRGTSAKPRSKKKLDPAQVREEIAGLVKAGAKEIAKKLVAQAKVSGELAPAKYLFEVASIYPASTDGSQSSAAEDSLAKTLMNRLNLPDEPVARDEDGEPVAALPAASVEKSEESSGEGDVVNRGIEES